MKPTLNAGEYVFCTTDDLSQINVANIILIFKESEGYTLVLERSIADNLNLKYGFVASWITLTVHSALDAIGFTAAFSKALTEQNVSCNVVAGYYHDHIFVDKKDTAKAMNVLDTFSRN